jgi:NAD(P)-dependent dehydrogenase (short-subunit alcohol dehydrogenase family)
MDESDIGQLTAGALPLLDKKALVTGASRGIGASVARQLAQAGAAVAINYRSKEDRAREVGDEILALQRRVLLLQGDITDPSDVASTFDRIRDEWQHLDILVLNASGGLERDKDAGYAMRLNVDAQVDLVRAPIHLLRPGGRIVFVTSHLAHFYGVKPVYDGYEPVAASKKAGEEALRKMIPELSERGIRLVVVSGDLIEGTITPKLLQRKSSGLIEARRAEAGTLPDVDEFAAAIVEGAVGSSYRSGDTIYVGSTDWS